MKKKMAYTEPIPPEVLRNAVALKAFLKDLYRKGYDRIPIRLDPARKLDFFKAISGKGRVTVKMTVPPGPGAYGRYWVQTPEGVVSRLITCTEMGALKDQIAGHKSSAGGKAQHAKLFGTEEEQRKRYQMYKAFMDKIRATTEDCTDLKARIKCIECYKDTRTPVCRKPGAKRASVLQTLRRMEKRFGK